MATIGKQKNLPGAKKEGKKQTRKHTIKDNPVPIEIRFGQRIHELRIQRRLPQDALASRAQVHRNYLSDVERGKRNVSLRIIEKLAKALGVEIAELFKQSEHK